MADVSFLPVVGPDGMNTSTYTSPLMETRLEQLIEVMMTILIRKYYQYSR